MRKKKITRSEGHMKRRAVSWIVKILLLVGIVSMAAIGLYARIWELQQPEIIMEEVQVSQLLPYRKGGGDLHWSLNGMRVYVREVGQPIDFPLKRWNDDIQVGDRVHLTVRRSFFGDELDGLEISKVR